jgi:hypothetical protein
MFYSFAFGIVTLAATLSIAIIAILYSIHSKISSLSTDLSNTSKAITEVLSPFKGLGTLIQQKGIEGLAKDLVGSLRNIQVKKTRAKDPLSPEKVARRNELINLSQQGRLPEAEGRELRAILEEEARIQFAEGLVTFLGFLALLGLIGLFIAAVTSSRD